MEHRDSEIQAQTWCANGRSFTMFVSISSSTQEFQANPWNRTEEDVLPLLFHILTVYFQSRLLKWRMVKKQRWGTLSEVNVFSVSWHLDRMEDRLSCFPPVGAGQCLSSCSCNALKGWGSFLVEASSVQWAPSWVSFERLLSFVSNRPQPHSWRIEFFILRMSGYLECLITLIKDILHARLLLNILTG